MLKAPMVAVFVAIALGVSIAEFLPLSLPVALPVLALAIALVVLAEVRRTGVFVASLFGFFALGLLRATLVQAPPPVRLACNDAPSLFRARVDSAPGRRIGAVKSSRPAELELVSQRCGDEWRHVSGRVAAELWGDGDLGRGDMIDVRLHIEPMYGRRNPSDADPLFLARKNDLAGFARVRSGHVVVARGRGLLRVLDGARDAVASRFEATFPGDLATVAKALSYGDQSAVGPEMRERWSRSGLAHLLSVSGLHVGMLGVLLYFAAFHLLAFLPGAAERFSLARVAALVALPMIVLFCLWAGSPPAAVRATVMTAAGFIGKIVRRPSTSQNALGVAGAGILLISPPTLFDPGFLLSFVAMAMLLSLPEAPSTSTWRERALAFVRATVTASIAAMLATGPIGAYYFGTVSLVGALTNLVGVPLGSALGTPLTLAYAVIAPVSERLAALVGVPLLWTLRALEALAEVSARPSLAAVAVPSPRLVELVAYYAALLVFLVSWRPSVRRRTVSICAVLLLASVGVRAYERFGSDELRLVFPYIGQGDATLVFLPKGGVMLVDAGGSLEADSFDPGRRVLAPLLRKWGIRSLDVVVLSHPHPDHLEGFRYLVEHFPIRELWWNGDGQELPTLQRLLKAVREAGGEVRLAATMPERFEREGVTFEVLHPRPKGDEPIYPLFSTNDNSLALRLTYKNSSVLLTGDLEREAEQLLQDRLVRTDVVKVGHHGSRTSSTEAFVARVRPTHAVISCGVNNRFGLPDEEVLERYDYFGARLWRTDRDGMVTLASDGAAWRATREREAP